MTMVTREFNYEDFARSIDIACAAQIKLGEPVEVCWQHEMGRIAMAEELCLITLAQSNELLIRAENALRPTPTAGTERIRRALGTVDEPTPET